MRPLPVSPPDEAVEEVAQEAVPQKPHRRTVVEGRLVVPAHWPKWKKVCGVVRKGRPPCRRWAVQGMATCKFHGSGGERNRELGQLRYLAWVSLGARRDTELVTMPIEQACRLSLAMFSEYIFSDKRNESDADIQIKAALWLLDTGRSA